MLSFSLAGSVFLSTHCFLDIVKKESRGEPVEWEKRYVLLLWLSITVLIPFDLSALDGSSSSQVNFTTYLFVLQVPNTE